MKEKLNIIQWVNEFELGHFSEPSFDTQVRAGWYDWFCRDSSLAAKTQRMGKIISGLKLGGKIKPESWYIFFKNNCPLDGPLYDDFRFADIQTGDVQFTIQLDCCWNKHKYVVYGRTPDGVFQDEPLFETDYLRELKKWFSTPWE